MYRVIKNLQIESQIKYLVSISFILVLMFSLGRTYDFHESFSQKQNIKYLNEYIPVASELIHELQKERGMSAGFISSSDTGTILKDLENQHKKTNLVMAAFKTKVSNVGLQDDKNGLGDKIKLATTSLFNISTVRGAIIRKESSLIEGTQDYTNYISELLGFINALPNYVTAPQLNKEVKAYLSILEVKENAGLERAMGLAGFAAGGFNADVYNEFYLKVMKQANLLEVFKANASPEYQLLYEDLIRGPETKKIKELENHVFLTLGQVNLNEISPSGWFRLITTKVDRLREIEIKLSKALLENATELAQDSYRNFWMLTMALIVLVGGASLISFILIKAIFFTHNCMQKDVLNQEERYSKLLLTSPFGMCETDKNGNIEIVNPAFLKMFKGKEQKEFSGTSFLDMISTQRGSEVMCFFEKALKNETVFFEFEIENDDTKACYSSYVFPIRSEGNSVTRLMVLIEDISPKRKHESDLLEAITNGESAQKAKTKFIANMNHEWRTPLNHILGFTQLLQSIPRNSQDQEMLNHVISGGEELLSKVNSIVDLSNKEEAQIAVFSLTGLPPFSRALKEFGKKTEEAGKNLRIVGFSGSIPVNCDPGDLLVAMNNVLDNALKFTAPMDNITIQFIIEDDFSIIKISDTGPGIPPKYMDHITLPFATVDDSYSRAVGGMGIGLASTQQLMTRNNGFLHIESTVNEGTCVSLKIPRPLTSDLSLTLVSDNTISKLRANEF